jgi:hypothetical protein
VDWLSNGADTANHGEPDVNAEYAPSDEELLLGFLVKVKKNGRIGASVAESLLLRVPPLVERSPAGKLILTKEGEKKLAQLKRERAR